MLKINRSNRNWNRSQRYRYHDLESDLFHFDWDRSQAEIEKDLLRHISSKNVQTTSTQNKNHLITYLNFFTKHCLLLSGRCKLSTVEENAQAKEKSLKTERSTNQYVENKGITFFTDKEKLCCLRISLFHDAAEVRAAGLRAIRYFVQSKQTLQDLLELQICHLIARSMDIVLENRIERTQALRLLRHIMAIEPRWFPLALASCLASISNDFSLEKDMLLRATWATIAELTIVNSLVAVRSGCINILIKCALNAVTGLSSVGSSHNDFYHGKNRSARAQGGMGENQGAIGIAGNNHLVTGGNVILTNLTIPHSNVVISEAILAAFLHLYNFAETRKFLQPNGFDLFQFVAPFTDLYSFLHASKAAKLKQTRLDYEFNADYQHLNIDQPPLFLDQQREKNFMKPNNNNKNQQQQETISFEQRSLRYLACKNALLSILRSWPGLFFMCRVYEQQQYHNKSKQIQFYFDNSGTSEETFEQQKILFKDSLNFFIGTNVNNSGSTRKLTQMVNNVVKAMGASNFSTSSFSTLQSSQPLNPLESLISILHLPYQEVHKHLLELLFEAFGWPVPEWSENYEDVFQSFYFNYMSCFNQNLQTMKRSNSNKFFQSNYHFPDEWQLFDGFVAKEAEHLLPNRSRSRLNYIHNYCALLLQALIEFGLLEALVSVILDSCDKSAVNSTTILLGELLHLSGKYLPSSIYAHRCQSLPTMVAASISDCRERRNQALIAITNLNRIHDLRKRRPRPVSLFLEQQIYFSCKKLRSNQKQQQVSQCVMSKPRSSSFSKSLDESVIASIRNSGVLRRNSFREWNFELADEVLRHPSDLVRKLEDKEVRAFFRRLLEFFLPSKRQFSMISKNPSLMAEKSLESQSPPITTTTPTMNRYETHYVENPRFISQMAIHYFDFLLELDSETSSKGIGGISGTSQEFLDEFVRDLSACLLSITKGPPPSDAIFIPSCLLSTVSNHYFLLIGRFTHCSSGRQWLKQTHIYEYLLDLINLSTNDVYIKLIVSSLDYTEPEISRSLLAKILTSPSESSRLYATQFLRVLLRSKCLDFHEWGIECLVTQLYDSASSVSLVALDILDEACSEDDHQDQQPCLEKLLAHRPHLFKLGDLGIVFFSRFASIKNGLNYLRETKMLENELNRWRSNFCLKYVRLVEDSLNDCFSCHQRGLNGRYGRRSDRRHFPYPKHISLTTYLAPHLYGQLVQTYEGLQILFQNSVFEELFDSLKKNLKSYVPNLDQEEQEKLNSQRPNELDILRMKSTIWALGHLASTELGIIHFEDRFPSVFEWMVMLVKYSMVLSIRATCFYGICLIGSTTRGAELLVRHGWTAIRHTHHDKFPIDRQEFEDFHLRCLCSCRSPMTSRLQSFSDKSSLERPKSMLSFPSSSLIFNEMHNEKSNKNQQQSESQFSSRSSSSSYLSIVPSSDKPMMPEEKNILQSSSRTSMKKPNFSSSSSTASIYSNTSSIGSLLMMNNTTNTNTITSQTNQSISLASNFLNNNRPRSSSDGVTADLIKNQIALPPTIVGKLKCGKPEYKDSGILEQSGESLVKLGHKVQTAGTSPNRNRKISAPCFAMKTSIPTSVSKEKRSDSDVSQVITVSGPTDTNSNIGNRSTSFTGYSSNSDCGAESILPHILKYDRNVSFSEITEYDQSSNKTTKTTYQQVFKPTATRKNQTSMMTGQNFSTIDDSYPSSIDAHGYAQLRAIHKTRVQSLSGNMFFSGIDQHLHHHYNNNKHHHFSSKHHLMSSGEWSDSNDENQKFSTLLKENHQKSSISNIYQQINEHPVDSDISMLVPSEPATTDNNLIFKIPSERNRKISRDFNNMSMLMMTEENQKSSVGQFVHHHSSPSPLSQFSEEASETIEPPLHASYSNDDNLSLQSDSDSRTKFMSLCLPQTLSSIFFIENDVENQSNLSLKTKRITFLDVKENTIDLSKETGQNIKSDRKSQQLNRFSSRSSERLIEKNGFDLHSVSNCLVCCYHKNSSSSEPSPQQPLPQQNEIVHQRKLSTITIFNKTNESLNERCRYLGRNSQTNSSAVIPAHILQRKEVLRLVSNLSVSIYAKQAEQGLLSLKQKFPSIFESLCFYSEICLQMESGNFRATARRFLHELFFDVNIDQLYNDAETIWKR